MASTRSGSKRLLRDLNRSIVLNLIAAHAPISRTDLAREGNLPAATVTHIVGDFVRTGLVSETQSDESSGGRRPVHLAINPSAGHVAGVKLREDGMTVAVCDLACNVVHHMEAPLIPGAAPFQAVESVAALAERVGSAIEARKTYPEAARRRGTEGVVALGLRVAEDGRLLAAKLAASSGSTLLDRSALDLASSVFPVDNLARRELELVVSVRYELKL